MQYREEGFCRRWSLWNQCFTEDVTVLKFYVNLFMLAAFIILIYSCQRCLSYKLATMWELERACPTDLIPHMSTIFIVQHAIKEEQENRHYRIVIVCSVTGALNERFLKSLTLDFISIRTFPNVPYRSCPCRRFPTITLLSKKVVNIYNKRQYLYTWLSLKSGHDLF